MTESQRRRSKKRSQLSADEPMLLRRLVRWLLISGPSQRFTTKQLWFIMYPDASEIELNDFEQYAEAHLHGPRSVDDGTS